LQPSVRHFAIKHRVSEADFQNHFWYRDQHRRRLIAGIRRTIQRFSGSRGLSIASTVDRIVFDRLIEHTVVRRLQRNRALNNAAKDQARTLIPRAETH
jgi:hypothetical protein